MKQFDKNLVIIRDVVEILSHKTHYRRRLIDLIVDYNSDLFVKKKKFNGGR